MERSSATNGNSAGAIELLAAKLAPLENEWVDELFPFHLAINQEMQIVSVGKSFPKISSESILGREFHEVAKLNRPRIPNNLTGFKRKHGKVFVYTWLERNIQVHGQIYCQGSIVYLLGSPRFDSVEQMKAAELTATDYSTLDQSVDFLMLKMTQRKQVAQLKDLTQQLHGAAEREKELAHIEKMLENDLNNAADIRIRLDPEFNILTVSSVREEFLPAPAKDLIGQSLSTIFPDLDANVVLEHLGQNQALAVEFSHRIANDVWEFDGRFSRTLEGGFLFLIHDETKEIQSKRENEKLQSELRLAERQAGMAEVATGILHNVGNILNSVNVSSNLLIDQIRKSPVNQLERAASIIKENTPALATFLTEDKQGKNFPAFLESLSTMFVASQKSQLEEIQQLSKNIEHIKEIVAMQQSLAKSGGVVEPVDLVELFNDALRFEEASLVNHDFTIEKEFESVPKIKTRKHDVLQILTNLIRNARQAFDGFTGEKKILLRVAHDGDKIQLQVIDHAAGISSENLAKIFQHGFTTKKEGHGFGLHACANTAQELGGTMSVASDGPGTGATFTLTLPLSNENLKAEKEIQ